jgi:hypothetical protein
MWLATLITIATLIYQVYQGEGAVHPSNIDIWAANNAYRQSCQSLLHRGMRSNHCDMALAMPLLPPPSKNSATASADDEMIPEEHAVKRQAITSKEDRFDVERRLASQSRWETVPDIHSDKCLGDSSLHQGPSDPRAEAFVPSSHVDRSSVEIAWSGQPSRPNTSSQYSTVSCMSPVYMLCMIVAAVAMYMGLYLCVRRRRSFKRWHIESHSMTGTYRKSSTPFAPSQLLCAEAQPCSWDINIKNLDGITGTSEPRIVLEARWQLPKQCATSPRRRRRRYHYPCGFHGSSRRRTDTEGLSRSTTRVDEHLYSDTEMASLEEAMNPKMIKVATGRGAEPAG